MADNRTMAQMLQAPIEGYEDAIVVPPINANNFELKQPLINLVQSNKFTGRQDPHNHLRFFNKVTSTFRHPEVPNTSVKLLLFPFSLDGEARDWLDKEPPRSILTWDDLVSKFINQYFPPSKTTYYRNEIITFYQKPNEAFNEAWERFKGLLRQCPHHGFSELHQLDTFYNSLNSNDQDALDSAAGGNFLDKMPQEGLAIIESKSKVRYSRSRANDSRVSTDAPLSISSPSNNSFDMQQIAASLEDKFDYQDEPNDESNEAFSYFESYVKANDAILKRIAKIKSWFANQMANVTSCDKSCENSKSSLYFNSGTLPSHRNKPRQQIIYHHKSGKTLKNLRFLLFLHPMFKTSKTNRNKTERTSTVKVQNPNLENTAHVPSPGEEDSISWELPNQSKENLVNLVLIIIHIPSKLHIMRGKIGLKDALVEMPKFNKWLSSLLRNKEKLEEIAITTVNAECSAIIMNKVPEKLEDGHFSFPVLQELDKLSSVFLPLSFTGSEWNLGKDYLEKDSIPPGIDLTLPTTLEVLSSNPTFPTLTKEKVCSWKTPMFFSLVRFVWKMMTRIAIRKKIICLLATYLHKKPKHLSQKVKEIKENKEEVSRDAPNNIIVMPIRITFDNPIDFNDHFSKPKDLKKDLTISFDSTTKSSILPHPLLDSDSPFTAELSASVTLNSLGNEDKVFKPGILVYHAIHDKNLITLKEKLKENISSRTLLVFKEPSFLLPPAEPPDECLKNAVLNFYQSKKTFPLNVEDVNSFAFIIWNFLPFFTYNKESPFIFSYRSENFVFDPGILTFHNPVAVSMNVSICSP
ncbi:reverse transcriptase domain-containing protein [Tanacetum coccineum]